MKRQTSNLHGGDPKLARHLMSVHHSGHVDTRNDTARAVGGINSLFGICLSVHAVVIVWLLASVWYYRTVGFHLFVSDGRCFERTALFEMAVNQIPEMDVEWNSSHVVYQSCLCTSACWWAHSRSFENRVKCWHACSETLNKTTYEFWNGSDAFVLYLHQLFEVAHHQLRGQWAAQGLPEHLEILHYYWIAKHMDERSAILNYHSSFATDLAILLDSNVDQSQLIDLFPDLDFPEDFKLSSTILEAFSAVKIENISVPDNVPELVQIENHFSRLWPGVISRLPLSTLSDIASLEVTSHDLRSRGASCFASVITALHSFAFHVPILGVVTSIFTGKCNKWVRAVGFMQALACFLMIVSSLWVQEITNRDGYNLLQRWQRPFIHVWDWYLGKENALSIHHHTSVSDSTECLSKTYALCFAAICVFTAFVGILPWRRTGVAPQYIRCGMFLGSFAGADFFRMHTRHKKYSTASIIAESVASGWRPMWRGVLRNNAG